MQTWLHKTILPIILGTSLLVIPLAYASDVFNWNVEILAEGGYDYTSEYYELDDRNGELVHHYKEIDGAEIEDYHSILIDQSNGDEHIFYSIDWSGHYYLHRSENGHIYTHTKLIDLSHPYGFIKNTEAHIDSDGDIHLALHFRNINVSGDDAYLYMTNSTYRGNWRIWEIPSTVADEFIVSFDMELDENDDAHFVYNNEDNEVFYMHIEEPDGPSHFGGTGSTFGGITKANFSNLNSKIEQLTPAVHESIARISVINSSNINIGIYSDPTSDRDDLNEIYEFTGSYSNWQNEVAYSSSAGINPEQFSYETNIQGQHNFLYHNTGVDNMTHIYKENGSWNKVTVWLNETNYNKNRLASNDTVLMPNGRLYHSFITKADSSGISKVILASGLENSWDFETIDFLTIDNGLFGSVSLDADTTGIPRLVYMDGVTPTYLKYAKGEATGGTTSVFPNSANPFNDASLKNGNEIGVSFQFGASGTEDLGYAYIDQGIWKYDVVDLTGSTGHYNSIDFDSSGNAHIVYYSESYSTGPSEDLMYASNKSGTWRTEDIEGLGTSAPNVGQYSDIAIDSNDIAHVSYYNADTNELKYAYADLKLHGLSTTWTIETVDNGSGNDVGNYSAIAVDSKNNVYISHYDATDGQLKISIKENGSWRNKTITNGTSNNGAHSDIAIDSNDTVYISYYNFTDQRLELATGEIINTRSSGFGMSSLKFRKWTTEILDQNNIVGQYSSINIDQLNQIHIVYYDFRNGDLLYMMRNTNNQWEKAKLIDDLGTTEAHSSINVDIYGNRHVTFFDDVPADDIEYIKF